MLLPSPGPALGLSGGADTALPLLGHCCASHALPHGPPIGEGLQEGPTWGHGRFAGTLRDSGPSRTQKLPIPSHQLFQTSGPDPAHATEVVVYSQVSSGLS